MMMNKLFKNLKKEMKYRGIEIPKELISLKKAYNSTEIKQLISYDDFKNFIIENVIEKRKTKKSNVVALNALQLRSKRFTNYVDINSNKQFVSLYNLNNIQLDEMLNHFVGQKNTEIINKMIQDNNSDNKILDFIKKNIKFKNTEQEKEFRNSKIINFTNYWFLKNKKK
jgi:hypothetical protein